MMGKMMMQPLLISDLIRHAAKYHADTEIVSRETDGKVASWQIPDAVVFTDAIPLDGTGKMLKNRLREKFGDALVERGVEA